MLARAIRLINLKEIDDPNLTESVADKCSKQVNGKESLQLSQLLLTEVKGRTVAFQPDA